MTPLNENSFFINDLATHPELLRYLPVFAQRECPVRKCTPPDCCWQINQATKELEARLPALNMTRLYQAHALLKELKMLSAMHQLEKETNLTFDLTYFRTLISNAAYIREACDYIFSFELPFTALQSTPFEFDMIRISLLYLHLNELLSIDIQEAKGEKARKDQTTLSSSSISSPSSAITPTIAATSTSASHFNSCMPHWRDLPSYWPIRGRSLWLNTIKPLLEEAAVKRYQLSTQTSSAIPDKNTTEGKFYHFLRSTWSLCQQHLQEAYGAIQLSQLDRDRYTNDCIQRVEQIVQKWPNHAIPSSTTTHEVNHTSVSDAMDTGSEGESTDHQQKKDRSADRRHYCSYSGCKRRLTKKDNHTINQQRVCSKHYMNDYRAREKERVASLIPPASCLLELSAAASSSFPSNSPASTATSIVPPTTPSQPLHATSPNNHITSGPISLAEGGHLIVLDSSSDEEDDHDEEQEEKSEPINTTTSSSISDSSHTPLPPNQPSVTIQSGVNSTSTHFITASSTTCVSSLPLPSVPTLASDLTTTTLALDSSSAYHGLVQQCYSRLPLIPVPPFISTADGRFEIPDGRIRVAERLRHQRMAATTTLLLMLGYDPNSKQLEWVLGAIVAHLAQERRKQFPNESIEYARWWADRQLPTPTSIRASAAQPSPSWCDGYREYRRLYSTISDPEMRKLLHPPVSEEIMMQRREKAAAIIRANPPRKKNPTNAIPIEQQQDQTQQQADTLLLQHPLPQFQLETTPNTNVIPPQAKPPPVVPTTPRFPYATPVVKAFRGLPALWKQVVAVAKKTNQLPEITDLSIPGAAAIQASLSTIRSNWNDIDLCALIGRVNPTTYEQERIASTHSFTPNVEGNAPTASSAPTSSNPPTTTQTTTTPVVFPLSSTVSDGLHDHGVTDVDDIFDDDAPERSSRTSSASLQLDEPEHKQAINPSQTSPHHHRDPDGPSPMHCSPPHIPLSVESSVVNTNPSSSTIGPNEDTAMDGEIDPKRTSQPGQSSVDNNAEPHPPNSSSPKISLITHSSSNHAPISSATFSPDLRPMSNSLTQRQSPSNGGSGASTILLPETRINSSPSHSLPSSSQPANLTHAAPIVTLPSPFTAPSKKRARLKPDADADTEVKLDDHDTSVKMADSESKDDRSSTHVTSPKKKRRHSERHTIVITSSDESEEDEESRVETPRRTSLPHTPPKSKVTTTPSRKSSTPPSLANSPSFRQAPRSSCSSESKSSASSSSSRLSKHPSPTKSQVAANVDEAFQRHQTELDDLLTSMIADAGIDPAPVLNGKGGDVSVASAIEPPVHTDEETEIDTVVRNQRDLDSPQDDEMSDIELHRPSHSPSQSSPSPTPSPHPASYSLNASTKSPPTNSSSSPSPSPADSTDVLTQEVTMDVSPSPSPSSSPDGGMIEECKESQPRLFFGAENARTQTVKEIALLHQKQEDEERRRLRLNQRLEEIRRAARKEERRQAHQNEEEKRFHRTCENLIRQFGSGSMISIDAIKKPITFYLPKRFLMTPEECLAEDKRMEAELNADRYENLNTDIAFVRKTDTWLNGYLVREQEKKLAEHARLAEIKQSETAKQKAELQKKKDEEQAETDSIEIYCARGDGTIKRSGETTREG